MNLSSQSNRKNLLFLIFFVLVVVSFNGYMGEDEGRFSYMGRIWANNDLPPYSESIENKTPGIFILNAISFSIFGTNIFFVRLLGILSVTFSSLLVFKITNTIANREAGTISMLVFGLTMSWRNLEGMFSSYTETFMILFILISAFLLFTKNVKNDMLKYILAGISMGFALAFKQIALTSALFIYILILFYLETNSSIKIRIKNIVIYSVGIILGTIISIIPVLLSGVSFLEYIDGAWVLLFDEGSSPTFTQRFVMARELWLDSRIVFYYPILLLLFFLPGVFKNKSTIFLVIWLMLDFIGVNASGYYFGHQIRQLMPSLSILFGIILATVFSQIPKSSNISTPIISKLVIVLIFALMPYQSFIDNLLTLKDSNYVEQYKEVGFYIKNNTNEDDYIYTMTNANAILSYTDRVSSTKYFNPLFMNSEEEYKFVLDELNTKQPTVVVKRRNEAQFTFPTTFHQFVEHNYTLETEMYGFEIYRKII